MRSIVHEGVCLPPSLLALSILTLLVLSAPACTVVQATCNSRNCSAGCCTADGQCVNGSTTNACGNGGNTCAVCPGTFLCSLGSCQPGSNGGGSGGSGGGGGFTGGGGGSSAVPGDVSFLWNFAGASCAAATVATVRVVIPGQALQNGGIYPCTNSGTDGIRLLNFAAATYSFTLEGLSPTNVLLYQSTGQFTVNGNVTVNANLQPTSSGASAYVSWTFPPNAASNSPNCTQAGMSTVVAVIDSGTPLTLNCTQGLGASVRIDNLSGGSHTLALEARDSNGFPFYRKTTSLFAQSGTPAQNLYLFDWAVGSLPLRWTFSNGTTTVSCAQAGVASMNIVLRDSQGNDVYGANGVDVNCVDTGLQGTLFTYLTGGTYTYYLQAYGTGGVLYHSNLNSPPSATVINGQFPVLDTSTPATLLTP